MTRASLRRAGVMDQDEFRSVRHVPKTEASKLPVREKVFAVLITTIVLWNALYLAWRWFHS